MKKYQTAKRAKYLKEVLRLYFEAGYRVCEIARLFPISGATVSNWTRTFAGEYHYTLEVMKRKSPIEQSAKPSWEESPETLKRRIKELEKRLSNAEFHAETYKTMIGSGMESIGSHAFGGCSELAQIDTRAATPPDITSDTFDEVDKTECVLNVPTGSINAYWIHLYWGLFFHINEKDTGTMDPVLAE